MDPQIARAQGPWQVHDGLLYVAAVAVILALSVGVVASLRLRNLRRGTQAAFDDRLEFERLLTDLSGVFANVPSERVEAEIQTALERLLRALDLGRISFFRISAADGRMSLVHSIAAKGFEPGYAVSWNDEYPWYVATLARGDIIRFENLPDDCPPAAVNERAAALRDGLRSSLAIPLRVGGEVTAAISFGDFRAPRKWSDEQIARLQTLGNVFANALQRRAADQMVQGALQFERLLAELSAVFANAPPDQVEAEIQRAMERLLTFLDLDRLTFLEIPRDTGHLRLLNSVTSQRGVAAYPTGWEEAFPWWTERLHRGDVVFAEDVSRDLPPEAWNERAYFESVGIRATATIPLRVGGEVRAAIGFSDFRTSRQWPRDVLMRLQTLGEVFANALARRVAAQALTERLEFERLLTELSANFANVPSERIHAEIPRALERLLDFLKLDRGALLVIRPKDGRLSLLHVANRAGVPPLVQVDWEEELPLWARLVHDGETVIWANPPDCLPAEAEKERARVLHLGIRAHLAIPLQVGGKVRGAICFADFKASRDWPPELVSRLRTLSEIFANALQRKAADEALEAKLNFERLLADLSAKFANLPGERLETEIGRAMEGLIEFFHLDRSTMLEVSHATGKLRLLYSAVSEFGVAAASGDWEADYPWWTGKVAGGQIVVIEQLADDLPLEAEAERAYSASIGLKSSLIVPMMVGGKFTGTLGFSDFRAGRKWPEETIARLKTLADIFANALERRARDRDLATRLEFAMFVADLSATFANVPGERVESQIELAMRRLLDVLDLDRCGFMIISKEDGRLRALRSVTRDENVPAILGNLEEAFPWWSGQLLRGEPVIAEDVSKDIPSEAVNERDYFRAAGLRATLTLPLRVGGKVSAAIGLASFRSPQHWPPEIIARLQLLGDIFVSALERRDADAQVHASEAVNHAVLASLPGHVAIVDRDGRIIRVNRAWEQLAGARADALLLGAPLGTSYLDEWRALSASERGTARRIVDALEAVLAGRQSGAVIEHPHASAGEQRWLEVRIERLDRPEGGAVVTHIDVSERKRAELDARRTLDDIAHLNRIGAMGELTSSLAHELNQPLAAILSNAQAAQNFLALEPPDLEEVTAIVRDIIDNDRRAGEVIRRMRALLKKSEFQPVALNLNDLVRDIVRMVAPDALLRKASIVLNLDSHLALVRGDGVQLQQVIMNLVLNGLDAVSHGEQGSRWVSVRTQALSVDSAELCVEDSGRGIAADALANVFQPFFTTKREGMGMGLSISRSIVELHGGSIRAENSPGGGALFRCTLPVARERRRGGPRDIR